MLSALRPLVIALCLGASTGASWAVEAVLFNDGRVLEIDGHDSDAAGNWILKFQGGQSVVSRSQVIAFRVDPPEAPASPRPEAAALPVPETLDQLAARLASELQVEPKLVAAVIAV